MAYQIKGRLLEVCNCNVLCPCWIGEDPDNGTCDTALAWHVDSGDIEGTDVSGLTIGLIAHIPGNILKGNIRAIFFIDHTATKPQEEAMVKVFTGKLGGPAADFAQLFGEVLGVERVPISFKVDKGVGTLTMGSTVEAELESYRGTTGQPTTFTIPSFPPFQGTSLCR